ncbi:MAG: DUF1572 family protein [Saprospiraceae bacterium]|nr:DUF1572 family protein [Saprospiraceae bacterium]MDP4812968.1 DUF1572 family protein [Saprospiraceae bacterium]MDP5048323.1 DUF1572 family protein [Saprospiraceae bacterium]
MENAFISDISEIFQRDLEAVINEVNQISEENLWKSHPGIINSTGTIAYHLCGNLRYFIGEVLGKDGYVRDKIKEFEPQYFSKENLIQEIRDTQLSIRNALMKISPEQLLDPMPDTPSQHKGRSIQFFLIQLSCHLSRHTGQLNYLRRILENK